MFDHYVKGLTYCRPEAYYFWGYYFFMNFIWIVIPGSQCKSPTVWVERDKTNYCSTVLLYSSISQSAKAFKVLDQQTRTARANWQLKKSD